MPNRVLYTRDQADRILPLVRAIAEDQREVYVRVRGNLKAFQTLEQLEEISGDHRLPQKTRDDLAELRGYMMELEELGIAVRDPELGLVAFEGLHGGSVVNFCWKIGEDRVRFWFPVGGDYAQRRPLDAALA
jgi:hypothetical protein